MRTLLFVLMITISANIFAQDEPVKQKTTFGLFNYKNENKEPLNTIFKPGTHMGGYIGGSMKYGIIENYDLFVMEGKFAWIGDRNFGLGMSASGFFSDSYKPKNLDYETSLSGGYFGMFVEPIFGGGRPVHFSTPIFWGMGGVNYDQSYTYQYDQWGNYIYNDYSSQGDTYFILKPGVELDVNVFKFLRFSFGTYYNFTTALDMDYFDKYGLNGWEAGFSLKLGRF